MSRLAAMLCTVCLGAGCAEIRVSRLDSASKYEHGVRFYRPAHYLIVGIDKDRVQTNSIITLPDKSDEYVAQVYNPTGLSSSEFKIALKDGWQLSEIGGSTQSPVSDLVNAFAGTVTAFKSGEGIAGPVTIQINLEPGWYRIVFDASGQVSALKRVVVESK